MPRKIPVLLVLSGVLLLAVLLTWAADHFDSPLANRDTRLDLADIYAFRSPADADNLVAVMTVSAHYPGYANSPLFANDGRYLLHVDTNGDLTDDATVTVTFSGTSPQTFSIAGLGATPITGTVTAAGATPIIATSGGIKAFCGRREDPFFFDLIAFRKLVAGPYIPVAGLRQAGTPKDFFAGNNVGAIVIEVPITALTGQPTANTGTIKVWASTEALQ